jgi:hypothetical protein
MKIFIARKTTIFGCESRIAEERYPISECPCFAATYGTIARGQLRGACWRGRFRYSRNSMKLSI